MGSYWYIRPLVWKYTWCCPIFISFNVTNCDFKLGRQMKKIFHVNSSTAELLKFSLCDRVDQFIDVNKVLFYA